MKKKVLILLTLLCAVANTYADVVEINGIYYNIVAKAGIAEVVDNPNKYSGEVVIPESVTFEEKNYRVTVIEEYAFSVCTGLTSITIPPSITTIKPFAFSGCNNLTSVHISDLSAWCNIYFEYTDSNPLQQAHHLYLNGEEIKNLVIPSDVTSIGQQAFRDCSEFISVEIPNSVTSIGHSAFYGCTGLTSIVIPDNIKIIEIGTFCQCSNLISITIGSDVTTIHSASFYKCTKLEDVYCYAKAVPYVSPDAFEGSYIETVTLHVPTELLASYSTSTRWNGFGSIVALTSDIHSISIDSKDAIIYDIRGNRLDNIHKGVNIIRLKGEHIKKVMK